MVQVCKGLCERQKSFSFTNNLRYKIGQKWCSLCALFLFTEEMHVHVVKQDLELKIRVKNMNCPECNHEKGKWECLCCCSISKISCVYCILPVLGYRQIKKILRKRENTDKKN